MAQRERYSKCALSKAYQTKNKRGHNTLQSPKTKDFFKLGMDRGEYNRERTKLLVTTKHRTKPENKIKTPEKVGDRPTGLSPLRKHKKLQTH